MQESIPATVTVDRTLCQTAATCLAYSIYELDDEAKAVLLTRNSLNSDDPNNPLSRDGEVNIEELLNGDSLSIEEMRELVLESARACPFNAIIVKAADGQILWPL